MLSTIVVTPRERFSVFANSLRSLFATIPKSTPVIVFDSGAPNLVRKELRSLREQRNFDLHETGALLPPQVRNLARPYVRTKYTCFCDNDVFYKPGWLQALEENAEAHGSGAVAPLTLIGPSRRPIIHHAGSEITVYKDRRGRPRLQSVHRLDGTPYEEALNNDFFGVSTECHEFEYHCAFIRTDVLDEIGGHDERQTKHDHLNDSLRILMNGHRITFERNAVITYHAFEPFKDYDWPFFFLRWSLQGSIDSDRSIGECWHARKNYEERELDFVRMHRRRAAATRLPRWIRSLRSAKVKEALSRAHLRLLEKRHQAVALHQSPYVPPAPPLNGLELARIPGAELLRELSTN